MKPDNPSMCRSIIEKVLKRDMNLFPFCLDISNKWETNVKNALALILILFSLAMNANASELSAEDFIRNCSRCKSHNKSYNFNQMVINTKFFEINKENIPLFEAAYYAVVNVLKKDKIIWSYSSKLDALGNPYVGISEPSYSPDRKAMVFRIIGNYLYKLIIVYDDASVVTLNGGNFSWEKKGRYLFSSIIEDTPIGFVIYDIYQKKEIVRINKLITDWKEIGDGKFLLIERRFLLEYDIKKRENFYSYSINLNASPPILRRLENRGLENIVRP